MGLQKILIANLVSIYINSLATLVVVLGATVMVILNDRLGHPPQPPAAEMEALHADLAVRLELASAGADLAVDRATRGLPDARLERERQWARRAS